MSGIVAEGAGQNAGLVIVSVLAIWLVYSLARNAQARAQWRAGEESGEHAAQAARIRQLEEDSAKSTFRMQLANGPGPDLPGYLENACELYLKNFGAGLRGTIQTVVPTMNSSLMTEWSTRHTGLLAWAAPIVGVDSSLLAEGIATAALTEFLLEEEADLVELSRTANFHEFRVKRQEQQIRHARSWAHRSAFVSIYGSVATRDECIARKLPLVAKSNP